MLNFLQYLIIDAKIRNMKPIEENKKVEKDVIERWSEQSLESKIQLLVKVAYYDGFNQVHYSTVHPDLFPVKECQSAGEEYLESKKATIKHILSKSNDLVEEDEDSQDELWKEVIAVAMGYKNSSKVYGRPITERIEKLKQQFSIHKK